MIRLTVRDLVFDRTSFAFSVLGLSVLIFAFLLLIPLSAALSRLGEDAGLPQNLILIERGVLQPEESRVDPELAQRTVDLLGDRLARLDPVIFRILRVEGSPLQLRGVARESWEPTFRLRLLQGSWPTGPGEVVLGEQASQDGGWGVGSPIEVYGRTFRVTGLAEAPGSKAQAIWMDYPDAEALFGRGKEAQLIVAHLQPWADAIEARQDLQDGLQLPFDVYFEDALLQQYGAALNDVRALSLLAAGIAVLAVLLGSLNLAWLTAEERVRWLGILRCLGFERAEVSRYLLLRAGMISTLAYLAALGAALAFIAYAADADRFTVGGAQASLRLGPGTALAGLALASLASVAGTWLLVRRVLRAAPATLLGRQAGGS